MSRPDDKARMRHILDFAREILVMTRGKARADLDGERQLSLAVVRLLEILGEAANHVSPQVRSQYPQIAWRQIIALRNRLIHGYDEVDLDIVWQIVQDDLEPLIAQLATILGEPGQAGNHQ